MSTRRRRPRWSTFGRYVLLIIVAVISIGPMVWELSTSLKAKTEDVYTANPSFVPHDPTFANFGEVTRAVPVVHFAGNSLIVAALVIVGNIVGATLAGYAMARLHFHGKRLVFGLFLSTLLLPGEVTIVSQFQTITRLGLGDSLLGVALPSMIGAVNVLLLRNAFMAIPDEVEQAAIVDGANAWQRLRYIGLPSVVGTLSIIVILSFIGAWDDFLWPLIVLQSPDKLTLTVGLAYLHSAFSTDPRIVAAGAMIALIPILIVFAALQRFFFRGVGEGAIKG